MALDTPISRAGPHAALVLTLLTLAACQSAPRSTFGYMQEVRSGRMEVAGDYNTVSGDGGRSCHQQRLPTVTIVEPPRHGTLSVAAAPKPLRATGHSPFSGCHGQTFLSQVVHYRSAPGYRGDDRAVYRVRYVDGQSDTYEKLFRVR
ncbi:hypothetical protein [Chelatococcus reniformis]|uniref:Uncharacterized protein n=1 Tax=Chelatococcus reniformis TaxID=1494448 RepID=A0A916XHM5_9HYPH|nr:hypothetical protein [Chelatococcus reniformis]GGC74133.1 hypothetical protein GCM10010994_35640 [Chelatococcus reniformis]